MTSKLRVWGMRKRAMARWTTGLLGGLAILGAQAQTTASGVADASPQLARGWIVKLKDSKPQPVIRLAAAAVPSDGAVSQRNRLWQAALRQRVGMTAHRPTAFGAQVMHAGRLMSIQEAEAEALRLRQDPDVEWVAVNAIERLASTTPVLPVMDPSYGAQTWLGARASTRSGVADFPAAWQMVQSPRATVPVNVAVLDTGILYPGDELTSRILPGYDFIAEVAYARDGTGRDDNPRDEGDWMDDATRAADPLLIPSTCENAPSSWHGTAIASMLVANTNNGAFGAGMLAPFPDVKVLPVRVGGVCGADRADIIDGMLWAAGIDFQGSPPRNPVANRAKVITLSFGGDSACTESSGYPRVIRQLQDAGVLLVASAGNGDSGGRGLATPTIPANCPGVLAVTALNERGSKATYANFVRTGDGRWGLAVAAGDVGTNGAALDGGVLTVLNASDTSPSSTFQMGAVYGTSFAAPQVAAVAAMIWSLDPSLNLQQVLSILVRSALPWADVDADLGGSGLPQCSTSPVQRGACRCTEFTCGSGVLDASMAVAAALNASSELREPLSNPARGSGGGGGGSISLAWAAALLALVAWQAWAVRCQTAVSLRTGRR
ncbi:S8 family serine peptidase [Aquabacterium fontiphilum]|uniref:S8 family serine peptidase n=1 Tax=Aquabacterium fontiphilum TaxID=450365 RepID=UPI00137757B4|nr:S8 family serine peptidase [Aquabacterium fontiphilum]NBD20457.1 S8 family serine peptidase [Aquabacterium fontiphilum]